MCVRCAHVHRISVHTRMPVLMSVAQTPVATCGREERPPAQPQRPQATALEGVCVRCARGYAYHNVAQTAGGRINSDKQLTECVGCVFVGWSSC
jgi:hypothetical protein